MRYLKKDYVMQEIIDISHLMQLNGEEVPELEPSYVDALIEWFLLEWNEIGDAYADWEHCLREFLRKEYKTKEIKNGL